MYKKRLQETATVAVIRYQKLTRHRFIFDKSFQSYLYRHLDIFIHIQISTHFTFSVRKLLIYQ